MGWGGIKKEVRRKEGRQLELEEEKGTWGEGMRTRGRIFQLSIYNHFNSLSSTVKRVRKMKGGRLNKNFKCQYYRVTFG